MMMNALESGGPPPAPQPNPQMAQQPGGARGMPQTNALAGGMGAPPQQGPQSPQQGQQASPTPTHKQMVGSLLHLHAFQKVYQELMSLPEFGRSDIKSKTIDGVTKLVAERFISAPQGVTLLGDFPKEPAEQRKWIQMHLDRDRQAELVLLSHHGASDEPTDYNDVPPADQSDDHLDMMGGMHAMYNNKGGNAPPPEIAIGAKQALRGFAEGGRPTPGQPALVGEQGPEVFVPDQPGTIMPNDQSNALFMQSGMRPTPPYVPQLTRAVPGYENIDPNELAMMRHREMVRPQGGRADIPMEHIVNALHTAGGVAAAPALMAAAPYLSPEFLASRLATRAPALAAGALGAAYSGAPTAAGEQSFRWQDPNDARVKRLDAIDRQLVENANKATKSAPGTQKALSDSLNAEKTKLIDAQNGEQADAFKRWQDEQALAAQQAAERKRAETSIFDAYPGARQAMAIGAPILATASGYGLGRKLGPWGGMAAGAFGGGLEGAASIFGPTEIDYRGLPRTSPTQQQAASDLGDWDWYKRAAAITAMNAGFGALGGFKGGMSRRGVLPMSTGPGAPLNPLSTMASGPSIPGAPINALAAGPPGQSFPTATASALATPKIVPDTHTLADGTVLKRYDFGKRGVRWYKDGKPIKTEQANVLRGKGKPQPSSEED